MQAPRSSHSEPRLRVLSSSPLLPEAGRHRCENVLSGGKTASPPVADRLLAFLHKKQAGRHGSTVLLGMRLLCALPLAAACAAAQDAAAPVPGKMQLMVTIDYCRTYPGLLDAQAEGVDVGVKGLIDVCERHGVVPTFFFSPYDYKAVGEEHVRRTARYILDRGCDIQLHTHPETLYDPKRPVMCEYSLEEQTDIVAHGIAKIREWTGTTPVAHRAGAYGADETTLRALAANGIVCDSSLFMKADFCPLKELNLPANTLSRVAGVIELPVSIYAVCEQATLFGLALPPLKARVRKVDLDWADDLELLDAILELNARGVRAATLFFHYYSFLRDGWRRDPQAGWGQTPNTVRPDRDDIRELDALLGALADRPEIEIVTVRQFVEGRDIGALPAPPGDPVPVLTREIPLLHYARKAAGIHSGNVHYYALAALAAILAAAAICYRRKRRRFSPGSPRSSAPLLRGE